MKIEEFPRFQIAWCGCQVGHVSEDAAGGFGIFENVDAAETDFAVSGFHKGGENAQGAGLPRAVRSNEAADLTLIHSELDVIDGYEVAVVDPQVANLDRWGIAICLRRATRFLIRNLFHRRDPNFWGGPGRFHSVHVGHCRCGPGGAARRRPIGRGEGPIGWQPPDFGRAPVGRPHR